MHAVLLLTFQPVFGCKFCTKAPAILRFLTWFEPQEFQTSRATAICTSFGASPLIGMDGRDQQIPIVDGRTFLKGYLDQRSGLGFCMFWTKVVLLYILVGIWFAAKENAKYMISHTISVVKPFKFKQSECMSTFRSQDMKQNSSILQPISWLFFDLGGSWWFTWADLSLFVLFPLNPYWVFPWKISITPFRDATCFVFL